MEGQFIHRVFVFSWYCCVTGDEIKLHLVSSKISMKTRQMCKSAKPKTVNCFWPFQQKTDLRYFCVGARARACHSLTKLITASDGIIIFTIRPFPRWRAFCAPDNCGWGATRMMQPVNVRQVWQTAEMETTDGCVTERRSKPDRSQLWCWVSPRWWIRWDSGFRRFPPPGGRLGLDPVLAPCLMSVIWMSAAHLPLGSLTTI